MENKRSIPEQQLFWIPERGIRVLLPPEATQAIGHAAANGEQIPNCETERLRIVSQDSTLKCRYPSENEGAEFMETVDYERRELLLSRAQEMTEHIVMQWNKVNSEKPISVILFGSVAKGLAKSCKNPDPSNIDLAVIGEFTDDERNELFDKIYDKRIEIRNKNIADCQEINTQDSNPGNIGVHIQHTVKLQNDHYNAAINYIGSGAFALHNESMWKQIEQHALEDRRARHEAQQEQRQRHERKRFLHGVLYAKPRERAMAGVS